MEIGYKIETLDVAAVLRGQWGLFRVTGPTGEQNLYTCAKGYSIKSITFDDQVEPRKNGRFLVEKIAEPVTLESDPDLMPQATGRHRSRAA
jgi:hypothetical protein